MAIGSVWKMSCGGFCGPNRCSKNNQISDLAVISSCLFRFLTLWPLLVPGKCLFKALVGPNWRAKSCQISDLAFIFSCLLCSVLHCANNIQIRPGIWSFYVPWKCPPEAVGGQIGVSKRSNIGSCRHLSMFVVFCSPLHRRTANPPLYLFISCVLIMSSSSFLVPSWCAENCQVSNFAFQSDLKMLCLFGDLLPTQFGLCEHVQT